MNEEKKTVGAHSFELQQKDPDTRDPIELEREIHKTDYEKGVIEAIETGRRIYQSPFYVVVLTKKERLMQNVLRHYFIPRQSCPTATWDQVVYKFSVTDEKLDFLWTVPDKETCELFRSNALKIVQEERWLLQFVLDFYDGTLDGHAKKLNGEIIS